MNAIGQSYEHATPRKYNDKEEDSLVGNAGIVPVPTKKAELKENKLLTKPKKEAEILTERHPYKEKDLLQQAEEEMEDMMEEMKGKIRNR